VKRFLAFLCGFVIAFCAVASAQSRSANETASIHLDGVLTLTGTQAIVYKTHFVTDGIVSTSGDATQAIWSWNTTPGNKLSFSFVIPSALTGTAGSLPFACGTTSAFAQDAGGAGVAVFNPNSGLASYGPVLGSTGNVHLGQDVGASSCTVDLSSSVHGDATGTIQLTVTVL